MFSEDINTAMSLWMERGHIELLLKIREIDIVSTVVPEGYQEYLDQCIKKSVKDYLDAFGGETDV